MALRRGVRAVWHRWDRLGSEIRKFKVKLRFGSRIEFGRGVWLGRATHIEAHDQGQIRIGARTAINDLVCLSAKGGILTIGSDGLVGRGSMIVATCNVSIGDDALIAEHVTIRDQDHGHNDPDLPYRLQGLVGQAIEIGSNVWLGAKVTVTRGVQIAPGTIVGANAVVTRSIDSPGVFAGAPAKRIR